MEPKEIKQLRKDCAGCPETNYDKCRTQCGTCQTLNMRFQHPMP